jgi:arabinosaccharide transport system substrate-binding protein
MIRLPYSCRAKIACRSGILSLGGWIIVALAAASSIAVLFWPTHKRDGLQMWTFARDHTLLYIPEIDKWNESHSPNVNLYLLSNDALARRMMSGFLSNTPVADLIEVEKAMAGQVFSGPLDDVGFIDLTDRLHRSGLYKEFNEPSFSPWTSRGHIFGLPHDIHPVMLVYRADLVEAAGIDMSQIKTWDDFARVLKPLIKDLDGDGLPDRYLLNLWQTSMDQIETLLLQSGGTLFDEQDRPTIDSDINATVISTIVSWVAGPNRIAADAPEFSASGNQLRIDGYVVCSIMPDWLGGVWKADIPQLKGKLKLMPLPAWTAGGRRTSVWGGTMLGIPKSSKDPEAAWTFAQHLYLSKKIAQELYETTNIVSPVKKFWPSAFYDKPDPYFSGEAPGRMYLKLAPDVPVRASSPFNPVAKARLQDAILALREYAIAHNVYDPAALHGEARRLLGIAQSEVQRQINRNVFLKQGGGQ